MKGLFFRLLSIQQPIKSAPQALKESFASSASPPATSHAPSPPSPSRATRSSADERIDLLISLFRICVHLRHLRIRASDGRFTRRHPQMTQMSADGTQDV